MAEDNVINQKIANFVLSKKGATVYSVYNGNEAIDFFKKNPIDLILIDLQMPGLNGFEASRFIRKELKSNIPIIALTADLFAVNNIEYEQSGINSCVIKPFDPDSLSALILDLVKNSSN